MQCNSMSILYCALLSDIMTHITCSGCDEYRSENYSSYYVIMLCRVCILMVDITSIFFF